MAQVHASACVDPQAKLAAAVDRLLSNPAARAAQLADCQAAVSLLKPGPEPVALLAAREVLAEIARR